MNRGQTYTHKTAVLITPFALCQYQKTAHENALAATSSHIYFKQTLNKLYATRHFLNFNML